MIIVKLLGNLGNQLFIYAMARSLQMQYGEDIYFDLSGLKSYYYSANLKLNSLNIQDASIHFDTLGLDNDTIKKFHSLCKNYHIVAKLYRGVKNVGVVPDKVTQKYISKGCLFNFNRRFYSYPPIHSKDKFVYGYFQSRYYFEDYKDVICQELRTDIEYDSYDKLILPKIQQCNSVGVSIRAINEHGVHFISPNYYYEGMKEIAKRIQNPVFYVFSDNLENVKNQFNFPYKVEYVTPSDSVRGLRILYNCKHFVISNSTFSWWGAYLSQNKEKVVVMPKPWDSVGAERDGIYMDNAILVDCEFIKYKFNLKQYINKEFAK